MSLDLIDQVRGERASVEGVRTVARYDSERFGKIGIDDLRAKALRSAMLIDIEATPALTDRTLIAIVHAAVLGLVLHAHGVAVPPAQPTSRGDIDRGLEQIAPAQLPEPAVRRLEQPQYRRSRHRRSTGLVHVALHDESEP